MPGPRMREFYPLHLTAEMQDFMKRGESHRHTHTHTTSYNLLGSPATKTKQTRELRVTVHV